MMNMNKVLKTGMIILIFLQTEKQDNFDLKACIIKTPMFKVCSNFTIPNTRT